MSTEKYYLYLDSYVFPFKEKDELLLYNTLNGEMLELTVDESMEKISEKLVILENNGTVELKEEEVLNDQVRDFAMKIKESFMGDLIKSDSERKPVLLTPILNIQHDVERMKEDSSRSIGEKIMSYLKGITFYINGKCERECDVCKNGYKQFTFCKKSEAEEELEAEDIYNFIFEAEGSGLNTIGITGGNILLYENLETLIMKLSETKYKKVFYINYKNIYSYSRKIRLFEDKEVEIKILVEPEYDKEILKKAVKIMDNLWIYNSILFVIRNEKDYKAAEKTVNELSIEDRSEYKPYYTGENLEFFRENVFTEKEDLIEEKLSFQDINGRRAININNFGKLTVFNNGDVYANVNNKKLSNIKSASLYDVIYKEIEGGANWFKTRDKVNPCSACIYKYLCPPISNYEYVIDRYNLCNIKGDDKNN